MENPNPSVLFSPPVDTVQRMAGLLAAGRRKVVGIVAPPGAGKSTLAQGLAAHFAPHSQYLPMDGFHLAQAQLERLGRDQRKGAPDTFDSAGFVALLQRIRQQVLGDATVYAPDFRRTLEEPIAGAIAIEAHIPLVITEGNYLLLEDDGWAGARALLDEVWYLDVEQEVRHERLLTRHMQFGRSREQALAWMAQTDEPNAKRIAANRHRADWVISEG
ncbi:nucleoside/nucleotide kinase family protein [Rhodoferax saidenbachensis]|uniref:Pantothenate kinase n=1 Tax=Rhodoferax saidenbachensis TaxID=1484693 RepID=A0ABU1ZNH1_9BURK|nr:pantothenate kinase [Rhodoferax saidenbachensis]